MLEQGSDTTLDHKLLEDPKMAKQALKMLQKTKMELDDFVDTLELLSNPRFRKNLDRGLEDVRSGKAVKMSVEDLRKRMAWVNYS